MNARRKAAFIKCGSFSHINNSVHKILTTGFPGYDVRTIDVLSSGLISKRDPRVLFETVKGYGVDMLLGRKSIHDAFIRTDYAFDKIRQAFLNISERDEYAFTFQTQSLFDASIPGTPHFLYTDHTHLANLRYPGFDVRRLSLRSWVERESTIYQHATQNFTMSSNITKSLIDDYSCSPDHVTCVYCGSNVQVTEDEEFGDDRYSRKNILFVGVDWKRKGGPTLAEAFQRVLVTHPDATLTVVGCAPRLNIPNCIVIGRVPLGDVKRYLTQASIFCLPTTLEPFGIVFLEAMAHRLPVIGTNIGAMPDFIMQGKNGFLVEPEDPEELALRIGVLIGSPDTCKAYGAYGHKLYWERYTWERTGKRMLESMARFLT